MEAGFVGPPVCVQHDGIPTSEEEDRINEEEYDICIHMLRLYEDKETQAAVEENHSMTGERKREFGG